MGDPGKEAWGRGSSPDPPVITYPSEKALAQLHPLHRLHVEHLPQLGFGSASPPFQKPLPLGVGLRRRVRAVDLASGPPSPPARAADYLPGAASGSRTVTPAAPPSPFTRDRAPVARAPGHARSPASPPPAPTPLLRRAPALARAAADEPLRTIALRPARLPAAAAARAPTPARCVSRRARARPWRRRRPRRRRRRRRVFLACPLALSRKLGSARAPVSALQIKKETASGCLGGWRGLCPEIISSLSHRELARYPLRWRGTRPLPLRGRPAPAGHAHPRQGPREPRAGLGQGRDCPRGRFGLRGGGVAGCDSRAPPSFREARG